MAAGRPVTGLVVASVTAAGLLAGHRVDAAAEGGGRGKGGITFNLYPWPQGHYWRVRSRTRSRVGSEVVPEVVPESSACSPKVQRSKRLKNQINFPEQKITRHFAPRRQLIPLEMKKLKRQGRERQE